MPPITQVDRVVLAAMVAAARSHKERRLLKRNIRMMEALEIMNARCRGRR